MTTDMLRCALRGVAAYRPVVDEPVMRLALGVLDKLSAGDGSGALCPAPGLPVGRWGALPGGATRLSRRGRDAGL